MSKLLQLFHQTGQLTKTHETDLRQHDPSVLVWRVPQNFQTQTPPKKSHFRGAPFEFGRKINFSTLPFWFVDSRLHAHSKKISPNPLYSEIVFSSPSISLSQLHESVLVQVQPEPPSQVRVRQHETVQMFDMRETVYSKKYFGQSHLERTPYQRQTKPEILSFFADFLNKVNF